MLNLKKIGCDIDAQQAVLEDRFLNWIGISIDTKTLGFIQNINTKKEAVLGTLNINLDSKEPVNWLKKKLKS